MREHLTRTHTRIRGRYHSHIRDFRKMCTHTYNECGTSEQAGRAGISLRVSIIEENEREKERAFEASEWAREGDGGGWKPFSVPGTIPTLRRRINATTPRNPPKILLVLRRWTLFYPCSSKSILQVTWISDRCEKELEEPRFTYQRIFILIP